LTLEQLLESGIISYIPFPDALRGKYQSYTQADIGALRGTGYAEPFLSVEQGVEKYVEHMLKAAQA
jgi:ADP-L-glycero-D-manno-heptose 6-epimerase